jgi:hypothetical protein
MAVARQLESADLDVPSLPPSAILLIRQLPDPLPGALSASARAVRADPRWQSALRAHVGEAARAAARPVHGCISGNPGSVLFADEAELVACLARELAAGEPPSWWREAIAHYARERSLAGLLHRRPDHMPAVIARLVRWQRVEEVVGRLTEHEARSLACSLIVAHQLSALFDLVADLGRGAGDGVAPGSGCDDPSAGAGSPVRGVVGEAALGSGPDPVLAPWRPWWPASEAEVPVHHELLVGLAVALQRAPAAACSVPFAARVRQWLRWRTEVPKQRAAAHVPQALTSDRTSPVTTEARTVSKPPSKTVAAPLDQSPARREAALLPHDRPPRVDEPAMSVTATTGLTADAPLDTAEGADSERWETEGVRTELAGLLFLVNVMEHLHLPDCFEPRHGLASAVGAIGTLEALARGLCHPANEDVRADPLWALLAHLDGRAPRQPPLAEGLTTAGLALPEAWLRSADGFVDAGDEETAGLRSALESEGWPDSLTAWLAFVLPFVRWRLLAALGADDDVDPLGALFRVPGRVFATDVHLDVVISVEGVRLPVRLAGLDRSPGWVQSMRRVVLFHFE